MQKFVWEQATTDGASPSRRLAGMCLLIQQMNRLAGTNCNRAALMTALYESMPEEIKRALGPDALQSCLATVSVNQPRASEQSAQQASEEIPQQPHQQTVDEVPQQMSEETAQQPRHNPPKTKRNRVADPNNTIIEVERYYRKSIRTDSNNLPITEPASEVSHGQLDRTMPDTDTASSPSTAGVNDPDNNDTAASVALNQFAELLRKRTSILFLSEDGIEYNRTILSHFDAATFNKSQKAHGFAYKLFLTLASEQTLELFHEAWTTVVKTQDSSQSRDPNALPVGLLGQVQSICLSIQALARSESKGFQANICFWAALYELDSQKEALMTALNQYASHDQKLNKINEQIRILNVGKAVRESTRGVTVASHVEYLARAVGVKYGLGDNAGHRNRNRQISIAKILIATYGKGIIGFIALTGYRSIVSSAQADSVSILAKFTQDTTNVQKLYDHIAENLVIPILENRQASEHGLSRLGELILYGNWDSLDD